MIGAGESPNTDAISQGNKALDDLFSRREESNVKYADIQQKREKSVNDVAIAKENKNRFDKP
jgi:hypothetical protein